MGHQDLTDDQVREIRRSLESGSALARRFGVDHRTIGRVRSREVRADVEQRQEAEA